jgi:hypothetical protein
MLYILIFIDIYGFCSASRWPNHFYHDHEALSIFITFSCLHCRHHHHHGGGGDDDEYE